MTKEELEANLGTIAKSGSLAFKQENADSKDIDHPVSLHHFSGLTAKWSSQMHQNIVDGYCQVI